MPWNITAATRQNRRRYQEDHHVICMTGGGDTCVAVFDGHNGHDCAEYAARRLPELLTTRGWPYPKAELEFAFKMLAEETQEFESGTAAAIALLSPEGRVIAGTLGDSLIIAKTSDTTASISEEHNVRTNLAEREAAMARGALYSDGYIFASPKSAGLQMSRGLGDRELASILSRTPTLETFDLSSGRFLFLCSDGFINQTKPDWQRQMNESFTRIEEGRAAEEILEWGAAIDDSDNATIVLCKYA